jgi:glutaredoxin 3
MIKKLILCSLAAVFIMAEPASLGFKKLDKYNKGTSIPSMELYVKHNCPYCRVVLNYIKENNLDITIKDASLKENANYLVLNGKKSQVPCLFIDGEPLYESRDIITYLINNL